MEAGACLASLGDSTVLDNCRFSMRVVLRMSESVSFQQISSRKGFGTDLALIWLFLRVHAHVATEMVQPGIGFVTLSTAVEPRI